MDAGWASIIGVAIVSTGGAFAHITNKMLERASVRKAEADQRSKDDRAIRDELRGDNDKLEAKLAKTEERLELRNRRIYEQELQIIDLRGKCSSENLKMEIALTELARCKKVSRTEIRKELFNGSDD